MTEKIKEPQINADEHRLSYDITSKIIEFAYKISNTLGAGFLEKVYENALCFELRKNGFKVKQQYGIKIKYENIVVGDYTADILVNDSILIELKTVSSFNNIQVAQCINYLKATNLPLCLLINFGKSKVEVRRVINERK